MSSTKTSFSYFRRILINSRILTLCSLSVGSLSALVGSCGTIGSCGQCELRFDGPKVYGRDAFSLRLIGIYISATRTSNSFPHSLQNFECDATTIPFAKHDALPHIVSLGNIGSSAKPGRLAWTTWLDKHPDPVIIV